MEQTKALLDYWYRLEFFSPLTIKKQRQQLIYFDDKRNLPWYTEEKKSKGYEVFVGTYVTGDLFEKMYQAINEKNIIDRDNSMSYLCQFKLDQNGKYIEDSFSVSPFIWAIAQVINHRDINIDLKEETLNDVNNELNEYLIHHPSFDHNSLKKLCEKIQLTIRLPIPYKYKGIIIPENKSTLEEENGRVIHSFYASEILKIRNEIIENDTITNYINALNNKTERVNIASNVDYMKAWTHPEKYPMGKWPSIYSPSLMQQIAINIGISDEGFTNNIFSVNGPPGTGKTTLLKEIIASNVVKRAFELSQLNSPSDAFMKERFIFPPNDFLKNYYKLQDNLIDYSIVVASNNNNAVENLSKELPLATEVLKSHTDLFNIEKHENVYFSDLAKHLEEDNRFWGLISLAGGKKENINKIRKIFDNRLGKHFRNLYDGKIPNWEQAKKSFINKYEEVLAYRKKLIKIYDKVQEKDRLVKELKKQENLKNKIQGIIDEKNKELKIIENEISNLEKKISNNKNTKEHLKGEIPIFIRLLIYLFKKHPVVQQIKLVEESITQMEIEKKGKQKIQIETNQMIEEYRNSLLSTENKCNQLKTKIMQLENKLKDDKEWLKGNFADDAFWDNIENNESSQLASPWTDKKYDFLREELFYEALQLHRAFILNSKEVRDNINCLMNMWEGEFQKIDKEAAYSSLFNTLMLISPVVSTTFASVKSFFANIGKRKLGTLIIDEAGQAAPYQALGAIWRARKTIVVGDPLQVEPVITVPKTIATIFADKLKIDLAYRPLELSVQVLADHVNRFGAHSLYLGKEIWLGCPLSVHRRCLDPMFTISNSIAYNNRMYNQTSGPKEEDKLLFAKSKWVSIGGKSKGRKNHFIKEQGDKVVEYVLEAYNLQNDFPNMFIISPFKSVAEEMKSLLRSQLEKILSNVNKEQIINWVKNSCGTIHTFQGKEANEVILVLGCDVENGRGAANWAGLKPNILNVAVTRAKYRVVILGDAKLWSEIPYFEEAYKILKANED